MFPGICILALISSDLINGSTLAALFGTIAGYVLSRDKEDSLMKTNLADNDSRNDEMLDNNSDEKEKLLEEISVLKNEIEKLKTEK